MSIRVGLRHMARSAVTVPIPEPWIDGWDYRKSHEIDGSVVGAQTDYLMGIKVNYGEGSYFENNGVHNPFYDGDNPSSVYYNGKTYIVWQGGAGYDPFIVCYDHSVNEWSNIVKVGTNPLSSDSHGAPVLLIDDSDYLHVFYGCKHTALKYAISDNPEDITSWTAQGDPVGSCTYPCPVMLANGDIYILYRHTTGAFGDGRYIKSDDDGATWGAAVQMIEIDVAATHGIYAYTPRVHGNNIHIFWRYHDGTNSEGVYHAYLNTTDGHMYSMDETDLGTSITKAEADANCRVVDTGVYITCHMAGNLDGDGYPYIIYCVTTDIGWAIRFVRWSGAAWEAVENVTTTDHGNNGMDFILHSATSITAFLIGDGGAGQGGDIDEWDWNGTTWSLTKTILSEADSGKPLIHPEVVKDYNSELMLIFSQYGGVDVTGLELYAYDGTNLVYREVESVYCDEHCKTDFGDIRFTESDKETELEYWMEKKVDSDYAIFWVKVSDIPADPDSATIYMYYGKADAVSSSTEMREDFTGYTEVEEIDDIQKTAYHVDFIDRRNRTTYLYKDYGANYFGDFAYHLDIKRVTHGASSLIAHILLADVIKGEKAMRDVNDAHLWPFGVGGDTPLMNSWESDAGGVNHKALPTILIAAGTMYYVSFRKYGTSMIVDVYTTQAKRAIGGDGDFVQQTITLQADYKFQYNYVGNTYDDDRPEVGSSDMESLLLRKYVVPEPIHGAWGAEEPH